MGYAHVPPTATGGNHAPLVAASASASASASVPNQEELYVGTRIPPGGITAADWDYLLEERIGIMHADPTLTEARAKALAIGDTIRTHGPRPQEAL